MIIKSCLNCVHQGYDVCDKCDFQNHELFDPLEELVREDERGKFITLLKSDLENYDGLADEYAERKDIHELLKTNVVRTYIESTIELLEKEE